MRSFAGSLSLTIATSATGLSIDSMRHGSRLIGMSPARRTSRTSIVTSAERPRAAEQREARALLVVGERRRLVRAVVDGAGEELALAGSARAVAAAVRQQQVGLHRRLEHRLVGGARERVIAGLYGNLERHAVMSRNAGSTPRTPGRFDFFDLVSHGTRCSKVESDPTLIRILLIGCGDVAMRAATFSAGRVRLYGLTRRADDLRGCAAHGVVPIVGDLDDHRTLGRLRTAPDRVLHFAPPPARRPRRPAHADASSPRCRRRAGYHGGSSTFRRRASTATAPARASRRRARVVRNRRARNAGRRRGPACAHGPRATASSLAILRAPGIYADTRLPLERLRQGTPVLAPGDDVYTNHIHADDLARVAVAAMFRAQPNRAYHVDRRRRAEDGRLVRRRRRRVHSCPRPPRVTWDEAEARIAPALLSFMSESRRLSNTRMKRELRVRLRYPTPQAMLAGSRRATCASR